jgi:hypothetical protein
MDRCLFCEAELAPGSEEHVFLAALGGRLATRRATCGFHNNHFARREGGQVDDALAEAFEPVRCGLMIWTGRNKPPPTLRHAGRLPQGPEYDLAPGFVPITRRAEMPDTSSIPSGTTVTISAANMEDARRILEIVKKRGFKLLEAPRRVLVKPGWTNTNLSFDGPRIWRAVGKTALVGCCVLFGNEATRNSVSGELVAAVRDGKPDIADFVGWDYTNPWPKVLDIAKHPKTPLATTSGFEHALVVADVGEHRVAYLELFGAFRFSIRMGPSTGQPAKGLAVNPRLRVGSRFILTVTPPSIYHPRNGSSFLDEHAVTRKALEGSMSKVLSVWYREATHSHVQNLADELERELATVGDDENALDEKTANWARKIAALEMGGQWVEDLDDTVFDDDGAA